MVKKIKDRMMNILQAVRGGSTKILVNNVTVRPPNRISQDIQNWRNAIQQAEGYSQQRGRLYDLYEDILLDGYLLSVKGRRVAKVTNQEYIFVKDDGTVVKEVSDLAEKSFFEDFITEVINSKFWGHSLLELLWPAFGQEDEGKTILIPRKNVKPRWSIVTKDEYDLEGVDYNKPPFRNQVIEVGKPEELGILMAIAQYVIYKRGNFGDWAEFAEIFGIPFRWATYNNEQSRQVLEQALEAAGPAGYVVAPEDAKLTFLNGNPTGNGSDVFRFLRQACNEEIGLAVLTNTMTTIEARSSGYAQSKTQGEEEEELTYSDRRFVLRVLNEKLTPYLERMGYPVTGGKWMLKEDEMSLEQRIEIDMKVSTKVPIAASYWYETYGVPKPKPGEIEEEDEGMGDGDDPEDDGDDPNDGNGDNGGDDPNADEDTPGEFSSQKKNLSRPAQVAQFYNFHHTGCKCGNCLNLAELPSTKVSHISANLERALATAVSKGNYDLNPELHRQYYSRLRKFARSGFARSLAAADDFQDFELQQGLLRNISEFAAAKQHALIEELRNVAGKAAPDYKRLSREILGRYHGSYLDAELITIESAANTAGQWQDFLDRADLYPNLKFSTVGDDRVRGSHAALDGATYPVNDPFWDSHTPPLDWRCRCVLIQTNEPVEARAAPGQARKGFGSNPAKSKALIQRTHPYFNMPDGDLVDLLEKAEALRAAIERPGIVARAEREAERGLRLDGSDLGVSRSDMRNILDSRSDQEGVRNSLLAALSVLLGEFTAAGVEAGTGYQIYQVTVLDTIFQFFFASEGDSLALKKLTAL
jgi:SPP1 gp7 family putative phage head morphogenesis protein